MITLALLSSFVSCSVSLTILGSTCTVWKCKLTSLCTAGCIGSLRHCHHARRPLTSWSAGKCRHPNTNTAQSAASLLFSPSSYSMKILWKMERRVFFFFVGGMWKRRGWGLVSITPTYFCFMPRWCPDSFNICRLTGASQTKSLCVGKDGKNNTSSKENPVHSLCISDCFVTLCVHYFLVFNLEQSVFLALL